MCAYNSWCETGNFQSVYFLSRYDLAALPVEPLSTLFDDTNESTLSYTTAEGSVEEAASAIASACTLHEC